MAKKQKTLVLSQLMELPTRTKTIDDNKVMDLFMKIIEQLLDDNQRLKNSLDLERKRNNLVFGGSHSPSRRK